MLDFITKDQRKVVRTWLQIAFFVGLGAWVWHLFQDVGVPPVFERDQWTQRDGFTAIAYGSLTRDSVDGLNSREQLAEHLQALVDDGYRYISTQDVIDFYTKKKPLPEKALYLMLFGGRKESVLFGQEVLGRTGGHAAFFTYTSTISSWNNFFVTKSNIGSVSKSEFWDVGSQGYKLMRLNENLGEKMVYFLCDFMRDDEGMIIESPEDMNKRLEDYYEESYEPLARTMIEPPQAYIFMPANAFSYMPVEVEEANKRLMAKYFETAFIREGPAFNSSADNVLQLSRMEVPPGWTVDDLMLAMRTWAPGKTTFKADTPDSLLDWDVGYGDVEIDGADVLVNLVEGRTSPAMLRNSGLWESVSLSTLLDRDDGERRIYLRYTSRESYLRLTIIGNRLTVAERLPHGGLVPILTYTFLAKPPWKLQVILKSNRLRLLVNGQELPGSPVPISAALSRGLLGLSAVGKLDYQANFGQLEIAALTPLWHDSSQGEIKTEDPIKRMVTGSIVDLPPTGVDDGQALRKLLKASGEGEAAVAALPEGCLALDSDELRLVKLSEAQSRKLWNGVLIRPRPGQSWKDVQKLVESLHALSFSATLRLSLETATDLAKSGATIDADQFVLDFDRQDMPDQEWTALANRHNRNYFLYRKTDGDVPDGLYSTRRH